MKPLEIVVLFDTPGPPPADQEYPAQLASDPHAPFAVARALKALGHNARLLGFLDDLRTILDGLAVKRPDLIFNLSEGFAGTAHLDMHVTGVLDLLDIPYTGSDAVALGLARDKSQSKKVFAYHGLRVPDFTVIRRGEESLRPSSLRPPLIVKPLNEDGSYAIAQTSVVERDEPLAERLKFLHDRVQLDAIVEELVEGRELYLGVVGNGPEARALPVVEMEFAKIENENLKIATWKAKWDPAYRKRNGIRNVVVKNLPPDLQKKLQQVAVTAYDAIGLRDYGRLDVRLAPDNEVYVLEVNPNPYIAEGEDFPDAAAAAGIPYQQLIGTIVESAMKRPRRKRKK